MNHTAGPAAAAAIVGFAPSMIPKRSWSPFASFAIFAG